MSGMKLINFIFVLLMAGVVIALGNLYLVNYDLFNRQVVFYGDRHIRVWALVLVSVGIGFFVNLLYNSVVALRGLVTGLNASAATRVGKRVSGHMAEARELMSHGLYAEAKGVLAAVLEERADHQGASILLGEVFMKLGDTEGAVKHMEAYCLAKPDNMEARYQLAEALLANRSSDAAVAVLKKIAADRPKQSLRAWRRLRALHTDAQRWDEALEAHRKLNQYFSTEMGTGEKAQGSALLYMVGLGKVEADQYKEAIQSFQQVLKEDSGFLPAQLALGRCMVLQDQEQQGVEIWLEGFRKTGEGTFLQEIEDYFIQIGKPDDGLAVLERVASTTEHATTAKFFLGKMLYRLEILDRALDQFMEVRSQVVYSPILFFFMAKIHARRGRNDQAMNEYRQLLRNLGVLKLRFECSVCGHRSQDYVDRCEGCSSWNSVHFMFKESDLPELPRPTETGSWMAMA
ncbi:MAG: tetratricopeptide repeat protein [Holophagaceae bacterium]|nr:tetratricopeptide repeat protein [Holophagaceae bacterium]